jgi:hypothetical protein
MVWYHQRAWPLVGMFAILLTLALISLSLFFQVT